MKLLEALGVTRAGDTQQAVAAFSTQPVATPSETTAPAASLYRAQAVAIKVALGIPAVRRARQVIAGTISTFTLAAWKGDTRLPLDTPGITWMRQPDPRRTLQWSLFKTIDDALWFDRCVWRILDRTIAGTPTRFERIHPERIQTIEDPHDPDIVDAWIIDGELRTDDELRRDHIVFDFAGLGGLKQYGAPLLDLYGDLQAAAGRYAKAPHPKAILKNHGADLEDDEIDALLQSWELARETSSVGYLNDAMDYEDHGWNAQELQLTEGREHAALEVARLFGLPSKALDAKSGDSMTYGNTVDARRDILESIRPWMTVVSQTLSLDDRTSKPKGIALPYGVTCEFDADAYVRDDPKVRMETWGVAIDKGVLTREEVRAMEPLARSLR